MFSFQSVSVTSPRKTLSFSLCVALISYLYCTAVHAVYWIPLHFSSSCTVLLSLKRLPFPLLAKENCVYPVLSDHSLTFLPFKETSLSNIGSYFYILSVPLLFGIKLSTKGLLPFQPEWVKLYPMGWTTPYVRIKYPYIICFQLIFAIFHLEQKNQGSHIIFFIMWLSVLSILTSIRDIFCEVS